MKIIFPEIEYSVKILPKPRGNWRPEVRINLKIHLTPETLTWRPYIPTILYMPQTHEGYIQRNIVNSSGKFNAIKIENFPVKAYKITSGHIRLSYLSSYPNKNSETFNAGIIIPILPAEVYTAHKRGEGQSGGLLLIKGKFWEAPTEPQTETYSYKFWLPWQPGRPDYSDFLEVFKTVPAVLFKLFQLSLIHI